MPKKEAKQSGTIKEKSAGYTQPPHVPTDRSIDMARTLAGLGMPQEGIGRKLGISVDTLYKYYKEYLEAGVDEANSMIAGTLFKKAKAGDTTCLIFWLKTRARWREARDEHDNTGPPIHIHLPSEVKPK